METEKTELFWKDKNLQQERRGSIGESLLGWVCFFFFLFFVLYFSHKKCKFFPCHKNADPDDFNCLFCYCPLYALGEKCGGNFRYTEKGIKDCTNCMLPHKRKNYGYVTGKYQELADMMKRAKESISK